MLNLNACAALAGVFAAAVAPIARPAARMTASERLMFLGESEIVMRAYLAFKMYGRQSQDGRSLNSARTTDIE
jgi:hypothetical protein